MKYLSLFSGIGGFELGIKQAYENNCGNFGDGVRASWLDRHARTKKEKAEATKLLSDIKERSSRQSPTCIGFSEIDKYAVQIYQKHFPEHKNYGDITKINPEELPDFDLLCGGFPCQSFSIAGKRGGFNDTRGTLFFHICRIAKAKKPMFMLLENVKGLVSHDGGKTLEVILASLQELGYYVNYEIRNSKDYGVPQNRERIFFKCNHIKLLSSVGQSEKITTSESIIQEWLFTLLLNNLAEVRKLQETASKDWVVGYLLLKEISQNPEWNAENILDGISIATAGGLFQSMAEPWQSIDTWLGKNLGESSSEVSKSTISTAIRQITESETYTYSQMVKAILLATVLLRKSSSPLWSEVLSGLTVIQEDTKYARINNKNEKAIITENGIAHLSAELQDPTRYFSLGNLRGTPRPKVFPLGEANETPLNYVGGILSEKSKKWLDDGKQLSRNFPQGSRVYRSDGISSTIASQAGGLGAKTGLYQVSKTIRSGGRKSPPGSKQNWDSYEFEGKIRRLTPVECERLQGFPDGWTERGRNQSKTKDCLSCALTRQVGGTRICDYCYPTISDTQRYKTLGNAVTVNVIQAIIEKIHDN